MTHQKRFIVAVLSAIACFCLVDIAGADSYELWGKRTQAAPPDTVQPYEGNIITLTKAATVAKVEGDATDYTIWRVDPAVEMAANTSVGGRADSDKESASSPLSEATTTAYEEYMEAYNAMAKLMAAGKGDTPEGQEAYQKFSLAKEKYEDFLKHGGGQEPVEVTTGETGIGTLGRERNRFEARGAPGNLEILSSYWKGGTAEWSTPVTFNGGSIGPADHHILYTGEQADGYNTGFLVYAPRGNNRLEFKVFHFSWADAEGRKPHGTVHYSGQIDLHNKTLIPVSPRFTRQASRLCEIEWRTTDGSSCRASLSMYKKGGTVLHEGYKDLGCEEGVYKNDLEGWKTKHTGPHGSFCPKADQWSTSGGGFVAMSGSHSFDRHWFRLSGSTPEGPYYMNGEDTKSPPRHSLAEVTQNAKIKQGTLTVRGPGALAYYFRRKSASPNISLSDTNTGQRFHPQTGGDQTMYQARNWVFKDGRWDGEWIGDFRGNVNDLYGDRPMSGWVPAGQIKTLDVFIEQGWYFVGGVAGFGAPSEIEYELWFFPREGGGIRVEP